MLLVVFTLRIDKSIDKDIEDADRDEVLDDSEREWNSLFGIISHVFKPHLKSILILF